MDEISMQEVRVGETANSSEDFDPTRVALTERRQLLRIQSFGDGLSNDLGEVYEKPEEQSYHDFANIVNDYRKNKYEGKVKKSHLLTISNLALVDSEKKHPKGFLNLDPEAIKELPSFDELPEFVSDDGGGEYSMKPLENIRTFVGRVKAMRKEKYGNRQIKHKLTEEGVTKAMLYGTHPLAFFYVGSNAEDMTERVVLEDDDGGVHKQYTGESDGGFRKRVNDYQRSIHRNRYRKIEEGGIEEARKGGVIEGFTNRTPTRGMIWR